jgi:acyl-CoA hydrolase
MHSLTSHKDLGIHTEIWGDSVLSLYKKGVITNKYKKVHPHKMVSTFLIGSKELYDFIDHNEEVLNLEVSFTNNPEVISSNPKVVAINSAIEIDLTGQVCADSIGTKILSGVGGQIDFIYGAHLSPKGKSIIALPSMTADGQSKIVATLKKGAGVVTTRAQVHYVVTEYGIASLYGKTLQERAHTLIQIAHPSVREDLYKQWKERSL